MLVATIGRLDAEHRAQHSKPLLPPDVEPAEVYQAAVTVLMRVVFLLYAEERGLLRTDDDIYADAYAISTLAGQLREQASEAGEDSLERSTTGWQRMLATFRVIHRGARHDQLTLPGYGGSLFDPDRFPWLEGRVDGAASLEDAEPLRVDDRTVLRALEALQWLRFAGERRRVSFRVRLGRKGRPRNLFDRPRRAAPSGRRALRGVAVRPDQARRRQPNPRCDQQGSQSTERHRRRHRVDRGARSLRW
jgi:hypothetical protein